MLHGIGIRIILQADVAGERAIFVVGPGVDEFAIDAQRVAFADAGEFVGIPFANRLERKFDGTGKWIKRAGSVGEAFFWFGVADFEFVALADCNVRIVAGIWEAKENSRVRIFAGLAPLAAQNEIRV